RVGVAAGMAGVASVVALVPVLRGADSMRSLAARLFTSRISVEVADLNAAGSYFAMAALVALALYESQRLPLPRRRAWALGAGVLLVAMWLTGSRTALICLVTVLGMVLAARRTEWRERRLWPIAAGVALVGGAPPPPL